MDPGGFPAWSWERHVLASRNKYTRYEVLVSSLMREAMCAHHRGGRAIAKAIASRFSRPDVGTPRCSLTFLVVVAST